LDSLATRGRSGRCLLPMPRADAGRWYIHDVGRSVDVPVLVVGGGPVGLLMGTGLRHFGVDCLVVGKHASTLDFPKGRRVTTRTVEIFRQWGLEVAVAKMSLPQADSLFSFEGETLLGSDYRRQGLPFDDVNRTSPTRELICSQERLEPVLRERARPTPMCGSRPRSSASPRTATG
jgi:putative polyketide hydroxylase